MTLKTIKSNRQIDRARERQTDREGKYEKRRPCERNLRSAPIKFTEKTRKSPVIKETLRQFISPCYSFIDD